MNQIPLNLSNLTSAALFVNFMNAVEDAATLHSDRYVVDPRSLIGVLALDLTKPVTLELEEDNPQIAEQLALLGLLTKVE